MSIGGTLTHFAAPPVLMVARPWEWDTPFMLGHFGWRAVLAIVLSTLAYFLRSGRNSAAWRARPRAADVEQPDEDDRAGPALLPVPAWVTVVHVPFMAWTVSNVALSGALPRRLPVLPRLRARHRGLPEPHRPEAPLLVGFFLAGLVIHGGLQGWWIAPVLASLSRTPLFLGATLLTAFNDNALITYLATLVPNLDDPLKIAVVEGAVTGGGLTVIANAPNPAGQALLGPILRRRHPAHRPPRWRAAGDANRDRGVQAALDRGSPSRDADRADFAHGTRITRISHGTRYYADFSVSFKSSSETRVNPRPVPQKEIRAIRVPLRNPRESAFPEPDMADDRAESPTDGTMRAEVRRILERRIDELPVAFRTVFVMREVEDMTVEETAACLAIPAATVRSRLFRARALLREALARDMDSATVDVFGFAGQRCDRIVAGNRTNPGSSSS